MAVPKQDTNLDAIRQDFVQPMITDIVNNAATLAWKRVVGKTKLIADETLNYPLGIGSVTGYPRAVRGSMNTSYTEAATGTVATWSTGTKVNIYWPLNLYLDDIRYAKTPRAIVDYVLAQTEKCAQSVRSQMEGYIWTAQVAPTTDLDTPLSLVDAIDGKGSTSTDSTYLGISSGDQPEHQAFVMESTHNTSDTGVYTSCANVKKMLATMKMKNGKYPDEMFTDLITWMTLADEFSRKGEGQLFGVRRGSTAEVGEEALLFMGVPLYVDPNLTPTDFTAGQTTRAAAGGNRIYLVDWDSFTFPITPGMDFQTNEWMKVPEDRTKIMCQVEFQGNLHCIRRRANGVIIGMDSADLDFSTTDPAPTAAVYFGNEVVAAATS